MRQPVSRISFDRRRGFLGVYLQEGAPFVDAAWNENADIAWSLLRDAILAAGVEGTAGRELRIDPILADPGSSGRSAADPRAVRGERARLRGLRVCGTSPDGSIPPRPFYCRGLPVLWLADLPIDAQRLGGDFLIEATRHTHVPSDGTWIDTLHDAAVREAGSDPRGVVAAYEIYLRARVETLDRLDDPNLDDPRLELARGTFRNRVIGEVRVRKAGAPPTPADTNLMLSVDGSYTLDLNALYRVELVALTGPEGSRTASVLWDPGAAATVARVVGTANQGARQVMVDSLDGFDHGFVRFEGQGIGPELYEITKTETLSGSGGMVLSVTRHRCDRDVQSGAGWQDPRDKTTPGSPDGPFQVSFTMPSVPPVQAGDVLDGLPKLLSLDWGKAKVRASDFDPDHNTVALTLEEAPSTESGSRALSVAGWTASGPVNRAPDGTVNTTLKVPWPIQEGDIVTALPPSVTTDPGPWIVVSRKFVTAQQGTSAPVASPTPRKLTITLGPAGLAQPLSTLDLERGATLRSSTKAGDTTLKVDARSDWTTGMPVRILSKQDRNSAALGAATKAVQEQRTIVRIVHPGEAGAPDGTMLVRLDRPLAYVHAKGKEEVIPARPIRVRRFAGHHCRLAIDRIDPAHDDAASLEKFPSSELPLPGGLALHLTMESAEIEPRIHPGDGWHFTASSDGSFETCLFAPVEDEPASEVPLAQLSLHADHYELLDLRPVPASLAIDGELARIGSAGSAITELLGHGGMTHVLNEIVRLSGLPRVQRALVQRLRDLADSRHPRLYANPRCRPWLQQLRNALADVWTWATPPPAAEREPTRAPQPTARQAPAGADADTEPTRAQVARIAFALGGLAAALSAEDPSHPPSSPPSPPHAPSPPHVPSTPAPAPSSPPTSPPSSPPAAAPPGPRTPPAPTSPPPAPPAAPPAPAPAAPPATEPAKAPPRSEAKPEPKPPAAPDKKKP